MRVRITFPHTVSIHAVWKNEKIFCQINYLLLSQNFCPNCATEYFSVSCQNNLTIVCLHILTLLPEVLNSIWKKITACWKIFRETKDDYSNCLIKCGLENYTGWPKSKVAISNGCSFIIVHPGPQVVKTKMCFRGGGFF